MASKVLQRQATIKAKVTAEGGAKLDLVRLDAFEALSEPFVMSIDVICKGRIDALKNLGKEVSVDSRLGDDHLRYFHGLVSEIRLLEISEQTNFHYRLTAVPKAWFHSQGSEYRIYQDIQVAEIIKKTLDRSGIAHRIDASGGKRKVSYCVQYGESDFAFASRLMEEEGLYYYYEHAEAAHTLVICDAASQHQLRDGTQYRYLPDHGGLVLEDAKDGKVHVQEWVEHASSGGEAKVTLADWDFKEASAPKRTTGSETKAHDLDEIEVYEWPGRFYQDKDGTALSKIVLEGRRAQRLRYEATCRYPGVEVGFKINLAQHGIESFKGKYLVIEARTRLAAENYASGMDSEENRVDFVCIPEQTRFRAPIVTPRPVVKGPETALVVGPDREEIWVDEYGRIKVRFHWDRLGPENNPMDDSAKKNKPEEASCWLRVSQTGGLGNIIHPRVGQEVIVDFFNGNPDRPIVVGRVYNSVKKPIYKLADKKKLAVWRSKVYKQDASKGYEGSKKLDGVQDRNGNEIQFDDDEDNPKFLLHAEKDLYLHVRDSAFEKIQNKLDIEVGVSRTELVHKNETITIKGDRKELVEATEDVEVKGQREVKIRSTDKLEVTKKLTITSTQEIELNVGASKIVIKPDSITINTPQLTAEALTTATLKSNAQTTVQSAGIVTVQGTMVKIN